MEKQEVKIMNLAEDFLNLKLVVVFSSSYKYRSAIPERWGLKFIECGGKIIGNNKIPQILN